MKRYTKPVVSFRKDNVYVALEDLQDTDFFWNDREIEKFTKLWEKELPFNEIVKQLRRSEISVFVLAFDRALKGHIKPREGWKIW